ncbi:MAG: TlpA disulfide reductase family protein, partial [Cocleimonas sp.]
MADNSNTTTAPKKRRWLRFFFEILIIVALVFGIRAWQQKDMVSGIAPPFQSVLLDGKTINLEDYRGKPLLLHFWAEWCPFCKLEEGTITDLQDDWQVLTVAYQSGDKTEVIKHMQTQEIESWPTVIDEDSRLADSYGVKGVPTSLIIDGNGNIRFAEVG